MAPSREPLLRPVLQRSFDLWRLEAPRFLAFGLLATMLGLLLGQAPLIGLPLSLAVDGPLAAGLVRAARRVSAGERPGSEDFLLRPEEIAPFAVLGLVTQGLALLASLLLLLPGLLLAALFAVAIPLQLDEPKRVGLTLAGSIALVRPRLGAVFGLTLLLAGLELLLSWPLLAHLLGGGQPTAELLLPLVLGLCLLTPFQGIVAAVLYEHLRRGRRLDHLA
jgi:hypothetical protein